MKDSNLSKDDPSTLSARDLRRRAQAQLSERRKKAASPPATEADIGSLVHELEVHQIELEMQNEELVQSHAQIETGLRHYSDLYDFAPVAYFTLTRDGAIQQVNLTGANMLGVARAALSKRRLGGFISRESRSVFNTFLEKAFASGRKETCEVALQKEEAVPFWAHVEATCVAGGEECRAVMADITERKLAEEEIVRVAQEWQQTFDAASDAIWLLDAEERVVRSNKTAELFFKRPCSEQVGMHCWEIVHGKTAPIPECPILRAKNSRRRETMELRSGDSWFSVTVDPILNATGQYTGAVHMVRDITARRQAEEELKQRENLLQKIYEVLPIGLWFTDKDGKLLLGNPAGVKIWGAEPKVSPSEYGVFKARRLPSGDEIAPEDWALAHSIREGVTIVDEMLEIDAFDGTKKVILNYSAPILDDNGKIEGAIVANLDITERKRMETELEMSEERFRNLFDNALEGIYQTALDGRLLSANMAFSRMFGYESPEEMIKTVTDIGRQLYANPDDRTRVIAIFREKGYIEHFECPMRQKDGSIFWVLFSGRVAETTAGIPCLEGFVSDISSLKRNEDLLRLKNIVFDASIAANSIADSAGFITEINEAFVKIWGYSGRDEVVGNPIAYFLNDPGEAAAIISDLNAHGAWQGDYTAKKKDGSTFVAHSMTTVIRNEEGQVTGYQSSVVDITEHRHAEEALREKEVQYRNLADTGLALVWASGTDKLCTYFNKPWLSFTGRTLEEELGNGWTQGVHPDDLDRCVQIYLAAFDKQEAFDMEYRLRHASGEYRWIRDLGTPNFAGSGEFLGYIGHCFDITAQRESQDEIRKLNQGLEQRVNEKTAELQQNINELEELNRVFVGRELKMMELKERIAELEKKDYSDK